MSAALHVWLNVALVLVIAGALSYASLFRYMTRGDE
jgi:hypothetical protein